MNHVEAMKLALEVVEQGSVDHLTHLQREKLIAALRTAIAEAEKQEPFGYFQYALHFDAWVQNRDSNKGVAFYTTPPAAPVQEPVAWMTINAYGEEDDIHYENPEGHLPDGWTYMPLYTHPPKAKQAQEEPLGYWNAVEGWVELPEEAHTPTAWVYPEALEAFQQGKPWTAYGADGKGPNTDGVERIPLYTAPPAAQRQPLTDEQISEIANTPPADDARPVHSFARAIEAAHGIGEKK